MNKTIQNALDALEKAEESLIHANREFTAREIIRPAHADLTKLMEDYVVVPKDLLESWIDYSCLREDIADRDYPNLRNDTQAMIIAGGSDE
jgi:hypothetical protein